MDYDNNMASALKRKRAPVEVVETPKRAKSAKSQSTNSLRKPIQNSGWDAAFSPPSTEQFAQKNGLNGDGKSNSSEAIDFEDFMKKDSEDKVAEEQGNSIDTRAKKIAQLAADDEFGSLQTVGRAPQRKDTSRVLERTASKVTKKKTLGLWKLSEPIGGHLVNVDPVFTVDEKYVNICLIIGAWLTRSDLLSLQIAQLYKSIRPQTRSLPGP